MQDQEFRLQVNVLFLKALLRQGQGIFALIFLPAALLCEPSFFRLNWSLIPHYFWESSGHSGFRFEIISDAVFMYLQCLS